MTNGDEHLEGERGPAKDYVIIFSDAKVQKLSPTVANKIWDCVSLTVIHVLS